MQKEVPPAVGKLDVQGGGDNTLGGGLYTSFYGSTALVLVVLVTRTSVELSNETPLVRFKKLN